MIIYLSYAFEDIFTIYAFMSLEFLPLRELKEKETGSRLEGKQRWHIAACTFQEAWDTNMIITRALWENAFSFQRKDEQKTYIFLRETTTRE